MKKRLLVALLGVCFLAGHSQDAQAQTPALPGGNPPSAPSSPTSSTAVPPVIDTTVVDSTKQVPTIASPASGTETPASATPATGMPATGTPPMGQGQPSPANQTTGGAEDIPRGNGKITGVVIDSLTNKPVEFASVALINTQTNRPVDGAVCDAQGKFSMNRVLTGTFRLLVSFVGYRNQIIPRVTVEARGNNVNLGTILLAPEVRNLKEVTVVGQQAMVEEKVDRLVYNAEKDLTAKGGDATDVMRKVPMLSVDLDGNVSLRGSSNVRVLINNKPSTIVASSVADALKQIPADMIKTVEVITSPSAKYDAEGSAGIINIVTKKNTLQGLTLNLDSGVGNRGANLGVQGNLRTGKMGFSLNGFGRANYNVVGDFENRQTAGTVLTTQRANTHNNGLFGQYQLGWDYDINKTTSLTTSIRYGARNQYNYQDKLTTTSYLPTTTQIGVRDVDVKDLSGTFDANVDFTKTYKPQQELSILTLFSQNNRTNNFIASIYDSPSALSILSRERNDNNSRNQETTFQLDYQTPIKTNQLLETGAKGIFRQVNSDYTYLIAPGDNGAFSTNPARKPNGLDYNQNVAAGYLSYTYSAKSKFTVKAGARYEYTFIDARFLSATGDALTSNVASIPSYGNLVPSINLSKSLKGGKTIKLAYNRRLQRPGIQFLNPNVNAANPQNITVGNPLLRAELTDNFEFSTSTYVKQVYINGSLFARLTNNSISTVRDTVQLSFDPTNPVLQRVLQTSYANIGQENAYGINLFGNATLFSKLQLGGGGDVYYAVLSNNSPNPALQARNTGVVVTGRLFASYQMKKGWGIQGFGFARGRQIQLQGYQGSFAFYSLGIRKEFAEKRGSFGVAAENFFNHPFTIRSESSSPVFSQMQVQNLYNAGVRATFSYRFGKMSFDGGGFGKRKKSVNNDDVKDGDNGGNGGQQPAAPAAPAGGGGRGPR
ncbi:TonB-dependent receptor domain-containing protein [Fibrella aquatilis]|uniref:TonB-dependent receptor n=1 Tax=Fibrella aquatilis TaxID=2817059 RepID=A0A939G7H8_9BACT|nr:outer membrane beta-barrel family protein [Fibrella aquatilis]MBO0931800.1 TonB-dependent receptor [Fibrella aquatilis]